MQGDQKVTYSTAIALFLGLVIIAAAIYFGHGFQSGANSGGNTASSTAPAVNITDVKTAGEPIVGDANAPVSMAVFFDYQCPFCKQFDQTVLSQIYTNYVQTGKVKIIFKDFDFIGPDSLVASEYSHAVWDLYPSQWYTWFTAMFAAQDEENSGFGDEPSVQKLTAGIAGIDENKVAAEVQKNKSQYDSAIQASFQEGQNFGINGTPSVIIGTTLLSGAQTYQAVSSLLDAQLKK